VRVRYECGDSIPPEMIILTPSSTERSVTMVSSSGCMIINPVVGLGVVGIKNGNRGRSLTLDILIDFEKS